MKRIQEAVIISYLQKCFILIVFIYLTLVCVIPTKAFATGNYGDGSYGGGTYGSGDSGGSGNSNSGSSGGSSSGSGGCTAQAPVSSPDLYQIDTTSNTAILYFVPSAKPYSSYTISYGYNQSTTDFSVNFPYSNALGAIKYTISGLNPNINYSFKVSAVNGCIGSAWSNIIAVKTTSIKGNKATYYKGALTFVNNTIQITKNGKSVFSVPVPFLPQQLIYPTNTYASPKTSGVKLHQTQQEHTHQPAKDESTKSTGKWFANIFSGIKNLFHL